MKLVVSILLAAGWLLGCASPGGIGVMYNKKGVVKYVFEHSPAENAGLMLEDMILNTKELRGPIGSMCHVRWKRGEMIYEKYIQRADVGTFKEPNYGSWRKK